MTIYIYRYTLGCKKKGAAKQSRTTAQYYYSSTVKKDAAKNAQATDYGVGLLTKNMISNSGQESFYTPVVWIVVYHNFLVYFTLPNPSLL